MLSNLLNIFILFQNGDNTNTTCRWRETPTKRQRERDEMSVCVIECWRRIGNRQMIERERDIICIYNAQRDRKAQGVSLSFPAMFTYCREALYYSHQLNIKLKCDDVINGIQHFCREGGGGTDRQPTHAPYMHRISNN